MPETEKIEPSMQDSQNLEVVGLQSLEFEEIELDGCKMLVTERINLGPIPEHLLTLLKSRPKTIWGKLFPFF